MGKAIELLSGYATAPGGTLTAITLAAGNSLTIRNAVHDSLVHLVTLWSDNQSAGYVRVRSPQLHDNVQGLRFKSESSEPQPLMAPSPLQLLRSQDQLTVEVSGSSTAGDVENVSLLVYYEDLPGIEGRFISAEELYSRTRNIVTVENTLSLGTTGGYTGEEAINAEYDLLKANTDYALLGYLVDGECCSVRWRGADTGNLGVGGPGLAGHKDQTREWFVYLSNVTGLPCIPVFNSANKAAILVDGLQDENGTDITLTSIFAELARS